MSDTSDPDSLDVLRRRILDDVVSGPAPLLPEGTRIWYGPKPKDGERKTVTVMKIPFISVYLAKTFPPWLFNIVARRVEWEFRGDDWHRIYKPKNSSLWYGSHGK